MHIEFERSALRLNVHANDPLHEDALDVLRQADDLCAKCMQVLDYDAATAACQTVASAATHALTHGRDDRVQKDLADVERQLHFAVDAIQVSLFDNALNIALRTFSIGVVLAAIWMVVKQFEPWNSLGEGLDLFFNYVFLIGGWTGFTLVGYSVGWLFLKSATVRRLQIDVAMQEAAALRLGKAHVVYSVLLCLILIMALFFFRGFDRLDPAVADLLRSAPWSILLGLLLGVAEPTLSKRVRGFFKF